MNLDRGAKTPRTSLPLQATMLPCPTFSYIKEYRPAGRGLSIAEAAKSKSNAGRGGLTFKPSAEASGNRGRLRLYPRSSLCPSVCPSMGWPSWGSPARRPRNSVVAKRTNIRGVIRHPRCGSKTRGLSDNPSYVQFRASGQGNPAHPCAGRSAFGMVRAKVKPLCLKSRMVKPGKSDWKPGALSERSNPHP